MIKPGHTKLPLYFSLALILLGIIIYWNAVTGPFFLDDHSAITKNPGIRDITDLKTIYNLDMRYNYTRTRFFLFLTFALNYALHGLNPLGYHIFNLAVHILNSLLVFLLVRLLFDTPALLDSRLRGEKDGVAFLTACIFLVHPIATEAVNYIYQRAESLFSLFLLLIVYFYIRARLVLEKGQNPLSVRHVLFMGPALAAGLLGAFTKENIMIYPAVLLLIEICFFSNMKKNPVRRLGYIMLYSVPLLPVFFLINLTERLTTDITRSQFCLTQINVVLTYLRLLVFPIGQNLIHEYPLNHILWHWPVLLALGFHLGMMGLALVLFHRNRLLAFAVLWFYLVISPSSSIQQIDTIICEYRVYLPSMGFALFVSVLLFSLRCASKIRFLLGLLLLLSLCTATVLRNQVWRTELALWEDTVAKSPHMIKALNNLGVIYSEQGQPLKAEARYLRALAIDPEHVKSLINLAMLYAKLGRPDEAMDNYKRALLQDAGNPQVFYNMGTIYLAGNDYASALGFYLKAEEEGYDDPKIHYNLALCYKRLGDYDTALERLDRFPENDPVLAGINIQAEKGAVYYLMGDKKNALKFYLEAGKSEPENVDVFVMIGTLFYMNKRYSRAVKAFEGAVGLDPYSREAHYNLGLLYKEKFSNKAGAIRHFKIYLRLAPEEPDNDEVRGWIDEISKWPDEG